MQCMGGNIMPKKVEFQMTQMAPPWNNYCMYFFLSTGTSSSLSVSQKPGIVQAIAGPSLSSRPVLSNQLLDKSKHDSNLHIVAATL